MSRTTRFTAFLHQVVKEEKPSTLRAFVAAEMLKHDDPDAFIDDLDAGGIAHGLVGSLVYTADTYAFFEAHYAEIDLLRQREGAFFGPLFEESDDLKNDMAWWAFDETARDLRDEFELGDEGDTDRIDPPSPNPTPMERPDHNDAAPEGSERTHRIATLNDLLRRTMMPQFGKVLLTQGIQSLEKPLLSQAIALVQGFTDFTADNNPHGERDFGSINLPDGTRVFWKIDYYDAKLEYGSDDPADPVKTKRVLTIMLADEY